MNWIAIIVAALVPTVIGFIWYNPKVFGTAWMKASGMTEEKIKSGNMPVIFGVSLLLSIMLSMSMTSLTIHQNNVEGTFMKGSEGPAEGSAEAQVVADFKFPDGKYSKLNRTATHGAAHGIIWAILVILPVMGTNALFERKGFKYILVNVGYWVVTFAIMGAIICGWV